MKTIGALVAASAVLLAIGPVAIAAELDLQREQEAEDAVALLLPAEENRHVPLICLDSEFSARAGEDRHVVRALECRPADRDVRQ